MTDEAICIRHWDYSETSQTVSLFTRNHGVLRGLAKGSKRDKGRFSGGIDLLARGEVVAIVKPGRDLATITDWTLQEVYWPLRRKLRSHQAALYFADLIHHMVHDHDPHPGLFEALLRALGALEDEEAIANATLAFQWALLCECGYRPELETDAKTGAALAADAATLAFDAEAGGVVDDAPSGPQRSRWRVRRETIDLLRQLLPSDAVDGDLLNAASAPTIERANRLLAAYIRHLLDQQPRTMSLLFPDIADV